MGWGLYRRGAPVAPTTTRSSAICTRPVALGFALIASPALIAMPTMLAAQTTPQPTTPTGLPTRQQVEQPGPQSAPAGTSVSVDGSEAFGRPPCALASSPLKVAIDRVTFVPAGRDTLPPAIAAILAPIEPTVRGEQPISNVCAIRDAANAALRASGYVASVQIPPQEITTGELKLAVVMARITEVRIHGEAGRYRDVLAARIAQIRALDPINERDAERILLLVGDVPGLDVRLSLRPAGTAPGDVIGDVVVATQNFAIIGNIQNYGSRQIGRGTAYLRGETYSVLTAGDIVYLGASSTIDFDEQQVVQGGYIFPIGNQGLTLGVRSTYAWSRPDLGLLDLRSRSFIGGLDVTLPVVRTVRRNLSVTGGAEVIEQRTRVFGDGDSSPLNRDRLRIGFVRLDGNLRGRRPDGLDAFALGASAEVRQGYGILNATRLGAVSAGGYTPSRFEGDPKATVVRADLDLLLRANRVLSVVTNIRAQYTDRPLLNFEEFAIGNLTVGRGYDPGANTGDRAAGIHTEARADLFQTSPVPLQFYGFADTVWLTNLDSFSTETDRKLRSVGGGLRVSLPGKMLMDIGYAHSLDRALSFDRRRPTDRVLLSVTAQLTPRPR